MKTLDNFVKHVKDSKFRYFIFVILAPMSVSFVMPLVIKNTIVAMLYIAVLIFLIVLANAMITEQKSHKKS